MSAITEAVVLAGGMGTRMRARAQGVQLDERQAAAAAAGTKAMIDVGRPFLDHVVTELAEAGITRVVLVVGPKHVEMRRYYTELATERVRIELATQPEPLGTANALLAAEPLVQTDRFLLVNSDNHYPAEAVRALTEVDGAALVGFDPVALTTQGNIDPARVAKFALLEVDEDGHLTAITEKPDEQTTARLAGAPVSMNCWALPRSIFDQAHRIEPSARGEYELPDAVRLAISEGTSFTVVLASVGVLDLSSQDDIAEVARRLQGREVRL